MTTKREQKDKRRQRRVVRRRQAKQAAEALRTAELSHHAVKSPPESRYLRFTLADLRSLGHPAAYIEGLRRCAVAATEHFLTIDVQSPQYRALVRKFQPARRRMYGTPLLPGDRP